MIFFREPKKFCQSLAIHMTGLSRQSWLDDHDDDDDGDDHDDDDDDNNDDNQN